MPADRERHRSRRIDGEEKCRPEKPMRGCLHLFRHRPIPLARARLSLAPDALAAASESALMHEASNAAYLVSKFL